VRLAVAGGTGVIGRRALPLLLAEGHAVAALVRDKRAAQAVAAQGAEPVHGDLLTAGTLEPLVRGADVVVNIASAIPTANASAEAWAVNDRVRREGTRNLLDAAVRAGAAHLVHTSVYLVYGDDTGDTLVDEAAPLRPSPRIESAVDGEELVRAARLPWTILRPGWLYDAGAWHTEELLRQVRAGEALVLDDAPAWRSPVHAADVAAALVLAAGRRAGGTTFNVADGAPVRAAELLDGLAALMGAPRPARLGTAAASERLGPGGVAALRRSVRLVTDRIRRELGWAPRHADWHAGFEPLLE